MAAITRASIKDQIYDLIRHKILTQELIFGEKINIVSITREFNVSNTPVREALSMADFITGNTELSKPEAIMLMSLVGNVEICQIVDPLRTIRFVMPKKYINGRGII